MFIYFLVYGLYRIFTAKEGGEVVITEEEYLHKQRVLSNKRSLN